MEVTDDFRSEIIDNNLPIYYSDMAKLLAENTNFGYALRLLTIVKSNRIE